MKKWRYDLLVVPMLLILIVSWDCSPKKEIKTTVSQEELTTAVPALDDLHSVIYPLWHEAYPNQNYALVKELLPQADSLLAQVNEAKLPGILRDKQTIWDNGKANLNSSLQKLHEAVVADDQAEILQQVETFHHNYERLVRTIRPILPELDAFHQELYKLYHYYLPNYELTRIRETVIVMQTKLPALKQAVLPKRLVDRQEKFAGAVVNLEIMTDHLADTVKKDNRKTIQEAVESVHDAYHAIEGIFD